MNNDFGADISPIIQWFHVLVADVNTTVRHWMTEIIVPIGAMDIVAVLFGIKMQIPLGVGEVKIVAGPAVIFTRHFVQHAESADW